MQRVISIVFEPKVSNASIIYAMIPYSPGGTPTLSSGADESAFSDCSFSDVYITRTVTYNGQPFHIYPAYSQAVENTMFSLCVTLYNAATTDIPTVANILSKIIAAGIYYTIELKTV